jgi:hypothetical protein
VSISLLIQNAGKRRHRVRLTLLKANRKGTRYEVQSSRISETKKGKIKGRGKYALSGVADFSQTHFN